MLSPFAKEFVEQSISRLNENTPRILKCLEQLSEVEVWYRPNENSNSIGNLILHLCGNIRQYAISSLGYMPDGRIRELEFSTKEGYTKAELIEKLTQTVDDAVKTIGNSTESNLLQPRLVQGFNLTGIGIIIHVTEHYSYHTGQITYYTKMVKDRDLGFYANVDLNVMNE